MCGLIWARRVDNVPASKMIWKRYINQKSRGSEGFGFVAIDGNKVIKYYRAEKETDIEKALKELTTCDILFHHRMPTSTPNFSVSAHPIKVTHDSLKYDYYVIHNGIIYNDEEYKTEHEKLGFKYTTEVVQKWRAGGNTLREVRQWNDSETLAIELARSIDREGTGIDLRGSIAFMMIQVEKTTNIVKNLYFGRNAQNPLKIEIAKGKFCAVTSAGGGESLKTHTLYSIDYATNEVKERPYTIGKDYEYNSAGFRDYDYDYPSYQSRLPATKTELWDDEETAWDIMALEDDYATIQKKLADVSLSDEERAELEEERLEIECQLYELEKKNEKQALSAY